VVFISLYCPLAIRSGYYVYDARGQHIRRIHEQNGVLVEDKPNNLLILLSEDSLYNTIKDIFEIQYSSS